MNDEQLINQLADLIHPHVKKRGDLVSLLDRVAREIWRREDKQKADDRQTKLATFKAKTGGLTWEEFRAKYGLHKSEYHAAMIYLPQHRFERGVKYFADTEPSAATRQRIAEETTLSKKQACDYLGITPRQFDKLKKQHGLEHVKAVRTGHTESGFPTAAYLYRKSDIDRLP